MGRNSHGVLEHGERASGAVGCDESVGAQEGHGHGEEGQSMKVLSMASAWGRSLCHLIMHVGMQKSEKKIALWGLVEGGNENGQREAVGLVWWLLVLK